MHPCPAAVVCLPLVLALALSVPVVSQTLDTELVASGLFQPTVLTHAGDDSDFLFAAERNGVIRVLENDVLLATPFLNISALVSSGTSERGLLGLAFHPNYEGNGEFFVNYTDLDGDTVLARYQASVDPRIGLPGSAEVLLTIAQTASNHNGGDLHFGLDGFLYMSSGDGGAASTRYFSLLLNKLLGKILRLDVDAGVPYGIPPGNPFGAPGLAVDGDCGNNFCAEIWASGLRNPWRMGFDAETGDLFVGDVGQLNWEEVDLLPVRDPGGVNLGWPCREANHNLPGGDLPAPPPSLCALVSAPPILEYAHSSGRCSITGGTVYRKPGDLYGRYLYSDYCTGEVFSAVQGGGEDWQSESVGSAGGNVQAFGVDEGGDVYLVLRSGAIRRIVNTTGIFVDGFEPGDVSRWSQ